MQIPSQESRAPQSSGAPAAGTAATDSSPSGANPSQSAAPQTPSSAPEQILLQPAAAYDTARMDLVRELQSAVQALGANAPLAPTLLSLLTVLDSTPSADLARLARELQGQLARYPEQAKSLPPTLLNLVESLARADGGAPAALQQLSTEILGALSTNNFSALPTLTAQFPAAAATSPTPDIRSLLSLLRLLGPVSDLARTGALTPTDARDVPAAKELRNLLISAVGIPLEPKSAARLPSPGQAWPATVQSVTPQSLTLQLLPTTASATSSAFTTAANIAANTHNIPQQQPLSITVPLPPNSPWAQHLHTGESLLFSREMVSHNSSIATPPGTLQTLAPPREVLLPHPNTAALPAAELEYWAKTGLSPSSDLPALSRFLNNYGPLPADPQTTAVLAQTLHLLDTAMPPGSPPVDADLVLRLVLLLGGKPLEPNTLSALQQFLTQPNGEADLLRQLPPEVRSALLQHLESREENPRIATPQDLGRALESAWDASRTTRTPAEQDAAQKLLQHLQFTRLDQDSRHPGDRQEVFYWFQQGELQKGRLRVQDQRGEKTDKNTIPENARFLVETLTPHMGAIQAEVQIKGGKVSLTLAESSGNANAAMQAERNSLAEELADLGLQLHALAHRHLRTSATPPSAAPKSSISRDGSALDLLA